MAAQRHFPLGCLDDFVSTPANGLLFFLLSKSKRAFALHAACLRSGVGGEGEEKAQRLDARRPLAEAGSVFSSASPAGAPGLGVWAQPGKLITVEDCQGQIAPGEAITWRNRSLPSYYRVGGPSLLFPLLL